MLIYAFILAPRRLIGRNRDVISQNDTVYHSAPY